MLLLAIVFPNLVSAQLSYITTEGTITITGFNGSAGALTIPDAMFGVPVTRIGDSAFKFNGGLTSITIGDNLQYLGQDAFAFCTNLTSVRIGNGLTRIEDRAFWQCKNLESLTIGNGLERIRPFAFYFCIQLRSLTLPNSVLNIDSSAFDTCISLTNIVLGRDLKVIGTNAFARCTGLKRLSIPDNVFDVQDSAFQDCSGLLSVTFGNKVARIGDGAFNGSVALTGLYFRGSPPQPVGNAFGGVKQAVAYYSPGASGWSSTFYGFPAVLWNPEIKVNDAGFGVRGGGFGFRIVGTSSLILVVEACDNLILGDWLPVSTNTLTGITPDGAASFVDIKWTNSPMRYYRLGTP